MNEIRYILRIASRRLELGTFIAALHAVAIFGAAIALVLALADRAPGTAFMPWAWVGPVMAVFCILIAALLWSRRRLSELQVAVAVDDRLDLREKLSTALHVAQRDDPFAQAAVEDAVGTARDPRTRETLRRRFRVVAPRHWWVSPLILLAAVGVLILPQANVFAEDDEPDEEAAQQAQQEVVQVLDAVAQTIEANDELNAELGDLMKDMAQKGGTAEPLQRPEQIRREALKRVTELNRRLDDIINGEKGKTAQTLEDMLAKLTTPESGPAKELAEALARGDFEAAKEAFEKLAQSQMSPEERQEAAEQLGEIAQQLQELAQQQQALEAALRQAGLPQQLANNPAALQQAIQQAQNLNEQQKQQLQQMAQAQQNACQACQGLGQALQQMAQNMQQGGQQQGGQKPGQQMGQQLGQLEQLQQLLKQAQAAAAQCQGQCQGLGRGLKRQQSGGMGRWGQGAGGEAPMKRTPFRSTLQKAHAPVTEGAIIASMLIDGSPIRGEVKSKVKQAVETAAEGYDDPQSEDALPLQYHRALQHYFGEVARQIEATETAPEQTPDAEGDAPAENSEGESGSSTEGDGDGGSESDSGDDQ